MRHPFHTLDVFTDTPFSGNPLAVVENADSLSDEQMQTIAREFNLSETVFVCTTERPAHTAKLRIFTPFEELPFAGHPTIGAAILLAHLRAPVINGEQDALIVLEQKIGTVRVGVKLTSSRVAFAEFDAPRLPKDAGALPPKDVLAAALGLIPSEIGFENHKPVCFAAGNTFAFVPVTSLEAIGKARIEPSHWAEAFDEQGITGVYLYTRQCVHNTSAFHGRMFAPASGIPEDPATGAAVVCLGGIINAFDMLRDGLHRRRIEQGYEMGRPSHIDLTIEVEERKLGLVRIGGHAVRITQGEINMDAVD